LGCRPACADRRLFRDDAIARIVSNLMEDALDGSAARRASRRPDADAATAVLHASPPVPGRAIRQAGC
jgi:hypothetical protein